jgi:hypothetical protein
LNDSFDGSAAIQSLAATATARTAKVASANGGSRLMGTFSPFGMTSETLDPIETLWLARREKVMSR